MTFLAKPDQSYEQHAGSCVRKWEEWINCHGWVLDWFAKKTRISSAELKRRTLLVMVVHDVGKMIKPFQDTMQSLARSKRPRYDHDHFRHEVASFPYALQAVMRLAPQKEPQAMVEPFAILGHHRSLDKNWRKFMREAERIPPILPYGIIFALEEAGNWMRHFGYEFPGSKEFRDPCSPPIAQAGAVLAGLSAAASYIHVSQRTQFWSQIRTLMVSLQRPAQ